MKNNLNSTKWKGQGGSVGCGDQMDHVFKAETNIKVMSKITQRTHLKVQLGWGNKDGVVYACSREDGL